MVIISATLTVFPAKAGIDLSKKWIPAFADMTMDGTMTILKILVGVQNMAFTETESKEMNMGAFLVEF